MVDTYLIGDAVWITAVIDTGDTVTVAIYDKTDGSAVSLISNSATEIGTTGLYRYNVNMTTPPTSGHNQYVAIFSGTHQDIYIEFNWNDNVDSFNGAVCIDSVNGSAGTDFPQGTPDNPIDNLTDAKTVADRYGFTKYSVKNGNFTINAAHPNWVWEGQIAYQKMEITFNNQNIDGSKFIDLELTGTIGNSSTIIAERCELKTITNLRGEFRDCGLEGTLTFFATGKVVLYNCYSESITAPILDLNGASNCLTNISGDIQIQGLTAGGYVHYSVTGDVILTVTNTGGTIQLHGIGTVTDNSAGSTILNRVVPHATWEELLSSHLTASTVGANQNLIDDIKTITDNLPNSGALTDIDTGVNNIEAKLPTNFIMGSSVQTDKDDEIDAIKIKTDNLPADPASETNVDANETKIDLLQVDSTAILAHLVAIKGAGWVDENLTTIDALIDAIKAKTDNLPVDPADQSLLETFITSSETNIRGVDSDTLKTLSDQLDVVQTDLDTPNQYKANVSLLATEANATTNTNNIISEIDNNETKLDSIITTLSGLNDITIAEIWDYLTTNIVTAGSIGKLLIDDIDATISSRASEANATTNTTNLTTEINENENKIDTIITNIAALNNITVADVWDYLLSSILTASSIGKLIKDNLNQSLSTTETNIITEVDVNETKIDRNFRHIQTKKFE